MSGACDAGSGSARRRRERRLRSWLRHERMTVRMELTAALHHSAFKGAGFETHDAPRSKKTVNSKRGAELFSLFEEELGGTRPDRLSDVRPQERVQRHTVEHLTDLVRFAPKVQVLDAPAPLVVEQLADVLALVEKKEREEDARMDQLENMILEGKSVSAADKEAWRRWARAGGQRENGRGGKESCRGRPCDQQLEFQQSKLVIMEAPQFQFIDRVLGIPVARRDR